MYNRFIKRLINRPTNKVLFIALNYRGVDPPSRRGWEMVSQFCFISRGREMVSHKAHNLKTAVRFGPPQQFGR